MPQQVNVYRTLKFFPGATVEGWEPRGEGTTYYVNLRTGSTTNDGLSWNSAVSQISRAITLSEAKRTLPSGSTNDYIRNTIIAQGVGEHSTGMYYSVLTALPLHCDIIGLGDWPAGLGQGIAAIGEVDGDQDGIITTSTVRGLNMFNLQVNGDGDTYNAMNVANFFRSRIEDCWFGQMTGSVADNTNSGIMCDNSLSSVLIRHCLIGQTNSGARPNIGLDFESCSPGSNNLIEDNVIFGEVTGILMGATDNWNGAVIRNNTIGGITAESTSYGIKGGLYIQINNNNITAADAINTTTTAPVLGNFVSEGGVFNVEAKYTTIAT